MKITRILPLDSREITLPDNHPYWDVRDYLPHNPLPNFPISLAHVYRHLNPDVWGLPPGQTYETYLDTPTTRNMGRKYSPHPISLNDLRNKRKNFQVRTRIYRFDRFDLRAGYLSFYLYIDVRHGFPHSKLNVTRSLAKISDGRNFILNNNYHSSFSIRLNGYGVNATTTHVARVDLHRRYNGWALLMFKVTEDQFISNGLDFYITMDTQSGKGEWIE